MAMARSVATRHAEYVAKLLLGEAWGIGQTEWGQLSMRLRLASYGHGVRKAVSCEIREILIFGSLARRQLIVGDVDLIVLDDGFYSPSFEARQSDAYRELPGNLSKLLSQWFELPLNRDPAERALKRPVDLHILPKEILWDKKVRTRLSRQHRDRKFFKNAFSSLLRFNEEERAFEPTDLKTLIRHHRPPIAQEVGQEQQA
jgi:predicted nucleotidyltransferase